MLFMCSGVPSAVYVKSCRRYGCLGPLWASVRKEMRWMTGLIFSSCSSQQHLWHERVHACDASLVGLGVLSADASRLEVEASGRLRKRFRFVNGHVRPWSGGTVARMCQPSQERPCIQSPVSQSMTLPSARLGLYPRHVQPSLYTNKSTHRHVLNDTTKQYVYTYVGTLARLLSCLRCVHALVCTLHVALLMRCGYRKHTCLVACIACSLRLWLPYPNDLIVCLLCLHHLSFCSAPTSATALQLCGYIFPEGPRVADTS